jgi:hypothetical protein
VNRGGEKKGDDEANHGSTTIDHRRGGSITSQVMARLSRPV